MNDDDVDDWERGPLCPHCLSLLAATPDGWGCHACAFTIGHVSEAEYLDQWAAGAL